MKVSNLFVSVAAAAAVVSAIGVAYAQTGTATGTAPGPGAPVAGQPVDPSTTTPPNTGTMNRDGTTMSERNARADRN